MKSYQKAWEQIVKPPKLTYDEETDFCFPTEVEGVEIKKEDLFIESSDKKNRIKISVIRATDRQLENVCVYLHTFTGNRLEGRFLIEKMLPKTAVVLFDTPGCGNAEEEYLTLGLKEKDDLERIIRAVYSKHLFKRLLLYGRSMGAATILHFLSAFEKKILVSGKFVLCGVVIDSSFTDVWSMVRNVLIQRGVNSILASMMMYPAQMSIKANIGYDVLGSNRPESVVSKLKTPAFFLVGEKDSLIGTDEFIQMFEKYAGPKKKLLVMPKIDHSAERPAESLLAAVDFLENCLRSCAIRVDGQIEKDLKRISCPVIGNPKFELLHQTSLHFETLTPAVVLENQKRNCEKENDETPTVISIEKTKETQTRDCSIEKAKILFDKSVDDVKRIETGVKTELKPNLISELKSQHGSENKLRSKEKVNIFHSRNKLVSRVLLKD